MSKNKILSIVRITVIKLSFWTDRPVQTKRQTVQGSTVSSVCRVQGERGGLVVNASGVQAPLGSNCVVSLSKAHLLPKSTGNTKEAGLHPNMTEKLFTGTLRINQPTNQRRVQNS